MKTFTQKKQYQYERAMQPLQKRQEQTLQSLRDTYRAKQNNIFVNSQKKKKARKRPYTIFI